MYKSGSMKSPDGLIILVLQVSSGIVVAINWSLTDCLDYPHAVYLYKEASRWAPRCQAKVITIMVRTYV